MLLIENAAIPLFPYFPTRKAEGSTPFCLFWTDFEIFQWTKTAIQKELWWDREKSGFLKKKVTPRSSAGNKSLVCSGVSTSKLQENNKGGTFLPTSEPIN